MKKVLCLDDNKEFYFNCNTPYEAINKMLYTLNIASYDKDAKIEKTNTNKILYFEHKGKTYVTLI